MSRVTSAAVSSPRNCCLSCLDCFLDPRLLLPDLFFLSWESGLGGCGWAVASVFLSPPASAGRFVFCCFCLSPSLPLLCWPGEDRWEDPPRGFPCWFCLGLDEGPDGPCLGLPGRGPSFFCGSLFGLISLRRTSPRPRLSSDISQHAPFIHSFSGATGSATIQLSSGLL